MENKGRFLNRRDFLKISGAVGLGSLVCSPTLMMAQTKVRLSIVTGGTGGVYYPYGGGMAAVLSKHLPGVEATAEVTAASVDNCKLVAAQKADLGFIMGDVGYDAFMGTGKFKEKLPLTQSGRPLLQFYACSRLRWKRDQYGGRSKRQKNFHRCPRFGDGSEGPPGIGGLRD